MSADVFAGLTNLSAMRHLWRVVPAVSTARLVQARWHMKILRSICGVSFLTTGLLVACGGANQEPAVSGTGATEVQTSNAQGVDSTIVSKLSAARCDREQTCNNVGAGQKYASRTVCMDQMKGSLANDLNASECPKGIDEKRLDQCLTAIRAEECSHPLDTISRMEKCRTGAMCMK